MTKLEKFEAAAEQLKEARSNLSAASAALRSAELHRMDALEALQRADIDFDDAARELGGIETRRPK